MDQTTQQAAIEAPDARSLSRAEPPSTPSSPRTDLLMAVCLLAGLVFGAALAWAREVGGLGFRTEGEVRAVLGLAPLGAVPRIRMGGRRGGGLHARLAEENGPADRALALLRGRLRHALADPRIVTVTRPGRGNRRSPSRWRSARREGERVLLIDGDRARPNPSRLLGAEGAAGLADLLRLGVPGMALLRRDGISGLDFLAAGRQAAEGQTLGGLGAALGREGWRRDYDLILIDAPPLLASTDALQLAEIADGVLFCLRWRRTPRRLALHARLLLGRQGGRAIGVAFTQIEPRARALRGFPEAEIAAPAYAAYQRR